MQSHANPCRKGFRAEPPPKRIPKNSSGWRGKKNTKHDLDLRVPRRAFGIGVRHAPNWMSQALAQNTFLTKSGGGSCDSGPITDGKLKSGTAANFRFPQRDHLTWAALISKHAKSGEATKALRLYEEMREAGVKPSSHTFVAGLKACSSSRNLQGVKQIHAEVIHTGFESDVYVGTMLVDVYVKCGSLVDARDVFDHMPCRTVVSWNAMILGCAQMEESEVALQLYTRMLHEGVVPDDRTFVSVLKACSCLAAWEDETKADMILRRTQILEQVREIHSHITRSRVETDIFVGTMLVDVYAKLGCLAHARSVFQKMPRRDVVSWTAMIFGYAQMEEGEVALEMYAQMQQQGLVPNSRTFVGVLKACSSLTLKEGNQADGIPLQDQCLEKVRAIHSDIVGGGFELDLYVGSMLVDVYRKCGSLADARRVFEKMPHRNVVSWTAMILGYSQMGEGEVAVELYERMQQEGVKPNDRTFVAALKACSNLAVSEAWRRIGEKSVKQQSLERVRAIHSDVIRCGLESEVFVGTMLVDGYAKCGSLVDASHIFEKMDTHDVVSWTAMILGYSQMDEGELALQCYAQMQQEGIVPDDQTFVAALQACGSVVALEKGRQLHAQISKLGLDTSDLFVASALIDMYGKCGSMDDAQQVFDACLPARDLVTWNALIAGYARQGESQVVFALFERLRLEGIQPNGVTYLSVLSASSHMGLVDKGLQYFEAITTDYGSYPGMDHYTCMIDLLGRAGQVDRAIAMVKAMPFQPDAVVWNTVLAACQKWRNVELGRQAFDCAIRLDGNNATAYVLMANIYSAASMWEEAKEIQAMRVKSGIWKQPGQTWWTDTCGIMHVFGVGDLERSEGQHTYAMLLELYVQLGAGYVNYPFRRAAVR